MSEVKSNYNFVPAPNEEQVFIPDWSNKVSHDIPLLDGESGAIEISMTAKTPVFIRNGHTEGSIENEFSHTVVNGQKKYFIPATSTKGMLRNVLEILSLSRLKRISDDRYSFRDLTRNSLYMRSYESNNVMCGWLYEDEIGNWKIEDCDRPLRISQEDLDPILKTHFRREFLNRNPKEKTAKYKYEQVRTSLEHQFKAVKEEYMTLAVKADGGRDGTIVLTGQSSKRKEEPGRRPGGKLYEFVFLKPQEERSPIIISEKQKQDFKFIYLDHDSNNISKDWKFWKQKLAKGERVPVFFNRQSDTAVHHFGLAYMYKLPYAKSIHETFPYESYKGNFAAMDLAETIFGRSDKDFDMLKGRVMVSHAFSENAVPSPHLHKEIMAGPKASYFPFYVDQANKGNNYITYQNEGVKIRGFKRYPVHKNTKQGKYNEKQLRNPKVFSQFRPLQAGAEFKAVIRFHNLKKEEIGALLSAITFHQQGKHFYHSIGGAKPLGFGKMEVTINQLQYLEKTTEEYLSAFEQLMERKMPNWLHSPMVTELLAMARETGGELEDSLKYPSLALEGVRDSRDANEFVNYKNAGFALPKYSEINGEPVVSSIEKKIALEKELKGGSFTLEGNTIREVKTYLKSKNISGIPKELDSPLEQKIREIYQANNKIKKIWDSEKFIFDDKKLYAWNNIITAWFGRERAFELYQELTGKEK